MSKSEGNGATSYQENPGIELRKIWRCREWESEFSIRKTRKAFPAEQQMQGETNSIVYYIFLKISAGFILDVRLPIK